LLRASGPADYKRTGWRARDTRNLDARLVRVLDFERALAQHSEEEQMLLTLSQMLWLSWSMGAMSPIVLSGLGSIMLI
jgi:hypothetical protein